MVLSSYSLCVFYLTMRFIMNNEMDFFSKSDIESALNRIDKLLSCGIFEPHNSSNPLMRAAFIEALISLRDLMYKTEKFSSRIDFSFNKIEETV